MKLLNRTRCMSEFVLLSSLVLISACGGETGEESALNGTAGGDGGIIGTAKVVVKSDSKVEAKSKSGSIIESSINTDGQFNLPMTNAETYLLRTKDSDTEVEYFSIAHSNGDNLINRNIHPYTDLIIRNWFATNELDINMQFNNTNPIENLPSADEVNAIEIEIKGIVSKVLTDYGVDDSINLIATPFEINGQGFDSFLDKNVVIINNNGEITIIFKEESGNAVNVSVSLLNISSDLTLDNDTPPTTPTNLIAYPKSSTSAVIRWKASTDDKGVSGYHVYREGQNIATTPYPLYTDSDLSSSKSYQYQVQAIDSRNQLSAKTSQSNPVTPDASAVVLLDGSYDVVVTSTSTESYCSGAIGMFVLTNEESITGSVTSITNSNYVFELDGTRDKNTGAVSGGFAVTQGITYATIDGVIDSLYSNGGYSDIRGCEGVWVATKQ